MWSWPDRGRGVLGVAATAGLGILLVVGAGPAPGIASTPGSASGVEPLPPPTRLVSVSVADLVVSVSVTPNRPGPNGFTVQATSSRRPPPAPVDAVLLRIGAGTGTGAGAGTVRLDRTSPGVYFGVGQLDRSGTVRITAVLSRAGRRIAVPVSWTVDPAAPPAAAGPAGPPDPGPGVGSVLVILLPPLLGALALGLRRLVRSRSRRTAELSEATPDRLLEGVS